MRIAASVMARRGCPSCRPFSTSPTTDAAAQPKILSLREAWPLLQQRFAHIRNDDGNIELLSTQNQAVVDRQTAPSPRRAAVLVLLLTVDREPSLLFTRRAAHLSQHAAEISFP